MSANVTFHPEEYPFKEGAVLWNKDTRTGEWASGHQDPSEILESVRSEHSKIFDDSTQLDTEQGEIDQNPISAMQIDDFHPTELGSDETVDLRKEQLMGYQMPTEQSSDVLYGAQNVRSTKGVKPTPEQISRWIAEDAKCTFQQQNPKGGKSKDRYEKYKKATTVRQIKELGGKRDDIKNDVEKGFLEIHPEIEQADSDSDDSDDDIPFGDAAKKKGIEVPATGTLNLNASVSSIVNAAMTLTNILLVSRIPQCADAATGIERIMGHDISRFGHFKSMLKHSEPNHPSYKVGDDPKFDDCYGSREN